jgi:hypothetical protein
VAEKVPNEVYGLARIEEVDGRGMAKDVNVAERGRQTGRGCVLAKEGLDPPRLEAALATEEECLR